MLRSPAELLRLLHTVLDGSVLYEVPRQQKLERCAFAKYVTLRQLPSFATVVITSSITTALVSICLLCLLLGLQLSGKYGILAKQPCRRQRHGYVLLSDCTLVRNDPSVP